jgi:hypothetical protein
MARVKRRRLEAENYLSCTAEIQPPLSSWFAYKQDRQVLRYPGTGGVKPLQRPELTATRHKNVGVSSMPQDGIEPTISVRGAKTKTLHSMITVFNSFMLTLIMKIPNKPGSYKRSQKGHMERYGEEIK